MPRNVLVQYPMLFNDVQATIIVAELTLSSARDVIRILSWLKSNAPQSAVIVVANKVPAGNALEITRKDCEGSIERKIDVVLPFDVKIVTQAAKLGKTIAEVGKGTKLGQAIHNLGANVLAIVDGEEVVAEKTSAKSGSLMSKIGNLKSILPGKGAKADKAEKAAEASAA